jgi:signal transduction histidine kinase
MNLLASLRNRVFLASVLLAAVTIGFAIYLIGARVSEQAEVELERGLRDSADLLEQQHTALSELFLLRARLVADLPRLKSAVDTRDPATVRPLAIDYQRQLNADILLVTDRDGHVLYGAPRERPLPNPHAVERALRGEEAAAFWPDRSGLLQVVTVPITVGIDSPDILGTLSAGFLLGDRRAEEFKRAAASDVAFAVADRIHAATVPAGIRDALRDHVRADRVVSHVALGDEDYVVTGISLTPPVPVPAGNQPRPIALVLRSRSSHLRALRTIQSSLLAAAGLAVALAIVLSYVVARSVTTPLGTITAEMREMAATGDLTRKIRLRGPAWSQDEDARLLATAFNTLTDSISRFQRQSAQRERLLSLGRLSTVIAHEVRNPLMIIKGSLRPLQSGAVPADVREAASDINEQVDRLNRIVHDVLDFARPLQFELSATDLAALCRDAAAAVVKDQRAPGIRVDVAPLPIVTDVERLRSALINVLTNARQASKSTGGDGDAGPGDEVVISAGRTASGRVRIEIRDCGPGIPPEHVPHVFEPYFTTRRSGTGLGLPITRNIIEGLGGTIAVRPGQPGTIVEIDLPETAAPVSEAPHL